MSHNSWLQQKNWAVVGASTNRERYGNRIVRKLHEHGFKTIPVSPKYDEVEGLKTYPSLLDIEGPIDVVNFVVNPSIGLKVLDECIQLGIKKIWLQPGTVSEALVSKAKENNIEVEEACILVALTLDY